MGRPIRAAPGGYVYHVLNRATARLKIFHKGADYAAFERVLEQAVARTRTRLLSYCVLPNHWHLVVWPREDGELSRFVGWLTLTHTQRWHAHRRSAGSGHLYPFGGSAWAKRAAGRLKLESTFRPRGRPKKARKSVKKGS
jgi:putative transposase